MRRVLASHAVFDLARLDGLSDAPAHVLHVSERTFYLLLNLVIADIAQPTRYAVGFAPSHYVPLAPSDPEYALWTDVVAGAMLEIQDMATLDEWLEQLDKRAAPIFGGSLEDYKYGTGSNPLIFAIGPVPAGELWHVSHMSSRIVVTPCDTIYHNLLRVIGEDLSHTIDGPVTMEPDGGDGHSQGSWWLAPGDYARAYWYGTDSNTQGSFKIAYSVVPLPLDE